VKAWIVPVTRSIRLVTPPVQPGVMGPYPVWGVWFSSHLPLEGTGCIQNFGP
jgi:hypothetical protein